MFRLADPPPLNAAGLADATELLVVSEIAWVCCVYFTLDMQLGLSGRCIYSRLIGLLCPLTIADRHETCMGLKAITEQGDCAAGYDGRRQIAVIHFDAGVFRVYCRLGFARMHVPDLPGGRSAVVGEPAPQPPKSYFFRLSSGAYAEGKTAEPAQERSMEGPIRTILYTARALITVKLTSLIKQTRMKPAADRYNEIIPVLCGCLQTSRKPWLQALRRRMIDQYRTNDADIIARQQQTLMKEKPQASLIYQLVLFDTATCHVGQVSTHTS